MLTPFKASCLHCDSSAMHFVAYFAFLVYATLSKTIPLFFYQTVKCYLLILRFSSTTQFFRVAIIITIHKLSS